MVAIVIAAEGPDAEKAAAVAADFFKAKFGVEGGGGSGQASGATRIGATKTLDLAKVKAKELVDAILSGKDGDGKQGAFPPLFEGVH